MNDDETTTELNSSKFTAIDKCQDDDLDELLINTSFSFKKRRAESSSANKSKWIKESGGGYIYNRQAFSDQTNSDQVESGTLQPTSDYTMEELERLVKDGTGPLARLASDEFWASIRPENNSISQFPEVDQDESLSKSIENDVEKIADTIEIETMEMLDYHVPFSYFSTPPRLRTQSINAELCAELLSRLPTNSDVLSPACLGETNDLFRYHLISHNIQIDQATYVGLLEQIASLEDTELIKLLTQWLLLHNIQFSIPASLLLAIFESIGAGWATRLRYFYHCRETEESEKAILMQTPDDKHPDSPLSNDECTDMLSYSADWWSQVETKYTWCPTLDNLSAILQLVHNSLKFDSNLVNVGRTFGIVAGCIFDWQCERLEGSKEISQLLCECVNALELSNVYKIIEWIRSCFFLKSRHNTRHCSCESNHNGSIYGSCKLEINYGYSPSRIIYLARILYAGNVKNHLGPIAAKLILDYTLNSSLLDAHQANLTASIEPAIKDMLGNDYEFLTTVMDKVLSSGWFDEWESDKVANGANLVSKTSGKIHVGLLQKIMLARYRLVITNLDDLSLVPSPDRPSPAKSGMPKYRISSLIDHILERLGQVRSIVPLSHHLINIAIREELSKIDVFLRSYQQTKLLRRNRTIRKVNFRQL